MKTSYLRYWMVSLGLTLLLNHIHAQVGPQGSERNDTSPFGRGLRTVWGAYAKETKTTPILVRALEQFGSLLVPQGVRHRVPQDYGTIQAAIDASNDGDTVLISEGTYKENIRYRGKAIMVASLYVVDKDTTHIAKTIIDGSSPSNPDSGSVVYFISGEDTTSVLCGLTIQGGSGTFSADSIEGWWKEGGGVFCRGAGPRLVRNVIARNRVIAPVAQAGGVLVSAGGTHSIILEGNRITDNYVEADTSSAGWGQGWAGSAGVRIENWKAQGARIVGNVFERDTLVGNMGARGGGLYIIAYTDVNPLPGGYIVGNVFRSNVLKATQQGAVGAGLLLLYTGEVTVQDNLFDGNKATSTGPNGWAQGGGMLVEDSKDVPGCGRKNILKNQFLNNEVASKNYSDGGGLTLVLTQATLSCNRIADNSVPENGSQGGGAGIAFHGCSFRVENNIFLRNTSTVGTGALYVSGPPDTGAGQVIINNTFVDNLGKTVGGLGTVNTPDLVLLNNIFWNDSSLYGDPEVFLGGSIAGIAYCNVEYGYPGDGNVDVDPAFVVGDSLLNLMPNSPLKGRGIDSIQLKGVWYYSPLYDFSNRKRPMPAGTRPDIGAQEEQSVAVGVAENSAIPVSYDLLQNYPNPFNPSTTIKYELPKSSEVRLCVFDMLGREVSVLVNERRDAGYHEIRISGSGLSSGVYLYRLQAGDFVSTKKLLLVK